MLELSLQGLAVMLAIPVNRDFPWQTENSIVKTISALGDRGVRYVHQLLVGSSIIETARSNLAHMFLQSEMNRLFWIDSDMSWEPKDFLRILALSSKMSVVGATYPAKRDPNIEFMMNIASNTVAANQWGCVPVLGMGLGFTCVAREVVEALAAQAPKITNDAGEKVPSIFHCGVSGEKFIGEDMNFFLDAQALGHPTWCDPTIELGHVGGKEFRGKLLDALQRNT